MVGYGRQGIVFFAIQLSSLTILFGAVFNYRSQYWIWSPILGSFCGGLIAALLYDVLIYLGPESPINTPFVIMFSSFLVLNVVYSGMETPIVTSHKARVHFLWVARALRKSKFLNGFFFLRG